MMLKKYTYYFLFIFTFAVQAQELPLAAGRTAGELAISATGAATYLVPLALPPGIKEVVPSLALSYNSQGGNGIAGWGWNIAGLSTISRVGATRFHDGVIDPVDLDELDRFALDGQRLILVEGGTYGEDGSVYTTENYSNIKVVATSGQNTEGLWTPGYFTVYYPDGSKAYYFSYSGLEWAIARWRDPQGNTILYNYAYEGGTQRIDKIYYGARSYQKEDHPNVIEFTYKDKEQVSRSYVGGGSYYQPKLLEAITIYTQEELYRHYQLTHDLNSGGYERLISLQEKTGIEATATSSNNETTTTNNNPPELPKNDGPGHQEYEKTKSTVTTSLGQKKPAIIFEYDRENYQVINNDTDLNSNDLSTYFDFDFNIPDINISQFQNAYFNGTLNDPNNPLSNTLPFDYDPTKHQLFPGDYNGDGVMDFVLKKEGKYSVYFTNSSGGLDLYQGEDHSIPTLGGQNGFYPATGNVADSEM